MTGTTRCRCVEPYRGKVKTATDKKQILVLSTNNVPPDNCISKGSDFQLFYLFFVQVKDVRNILGVKTFVSKIKCVSESHPLKKCVPETGKVGTQH